MNSAQGALEYLLIIGGAILIASIVIMLSINAANPISSSTKTEVLTSLCLGASSETECNARDPDSSGVCIPGECKWDNGRCVANPNRGAECFGGSESQPPETCTDSEQRNCPKQDGVCLNSKETCAEGIWPGCSASEYGADYETVETKCSDSLDNDCDSFVDCLDSDCSSLPACLPLLQKSVKIEYPTYYTNFATEYLVDGTKQTYSTLETVRDFLVSKIDLTIEGVVAQYNPWAWDRIDKYNPTMISIPNESIMGLSAETPELLNAIDSFENAFVHAYIPEKTIPVSKDSRLMTRCKEDGPSDARIYLMNPVQEWREKYSDYLVNEFAADPRLNGVFMDEGMTYLDTRYQYAPIGYYSWYWWLVQNEPHAVALGATEITTEFNIHVDTPSYTCDYYNPENPGKKIKIVSAKDQGGIEIEILSHDSTKITLTNPIPSAQTVTVSYYSVADAPPDVKSAWKQNMIDTVAYVRQRIPDKLFIYNGVQCYGSHKTDDDAFWSYVDGGMFENYGHAAWDNYAQPPTESNLVQEIDELKLRSQDKIFLAQGGVDTTSGTESDWKKRAMFAFAAFLLGKGQNAYFDFSYSPYDYSKFVYFDYWEANIGNPVSDYSLRGKIGNSNIYQRQFENALVLVNPSDDPATVTIDLGANDYQHYFDIEGTVHSFSGTTIDLPSKTGIILMKQ